MKPRLMMIVFVTICLITFLPVFGQKNYYVIVSAFSTDGTAKDFTTHLPSFDSDTAYALSDELLSSSNAIEGKKISVRKIETAFENSRITTAGANPPVTTQTNAEIPSSNTKGSFFKFTIVNQEGIALPGNIHNVDFAVGKELAVYEANTYVDLSTFAKRKKLTLTCGVFGYNFSEKNMNYADPSLIEDAFQDEKGAWVIPYKLERLGKGDVSIMYNVAFHKDAVIMISQSRNNLDELVKLMAENPDYRIMIHGHCNGKNHRRIIAMGAEQQFFDINGSQEIYGSAKMLSNLRSHAVRAYLIEHGISEDRIKTYAWGGSYMLVNQNGPYSKLNDRIEIEILN